jgi:hypothetical protein
VEVMAEGKRNLSKLSRSGSVFVELFVFWQAQLLGHPAKMSFLGDAVLGVMMEQ